MATSPVRIDRTTYRIDRTLCRTLHEAAAEEGSAGTLRISRKNVASIVAAIGDGAGVSKTERPAVNALLAAASGAPITLRFREHGAFGPPRLVDISSYAGRVLLQSFGRWVK
ncbi:MAG: hypothetical protein IT381_04485 [Deltaproteobacteria bacterium]|nr:hypothetical protein [Deltaproteobacteria bacterium]